MVVVVGGVCGKGWGGGWRGFARLESFSSCATIQSRALTSHTLDYPFFVS